MNKRLINLGVKSLRTGKIGRFLLVILIILVISGINQYWPTTPAATTSTNVTGASANSTVVPTKPVLTAGQFSAKVVYVVDGDTLDYELNGEKKRVRLMGIDTPETKDPRKPVQCFGLAAALKTKELLTDKMVIFTKDSKETLDKYGRELLYISLPDGTEVNRLLVAEGFAFATPQYNFDRRDEFVNLEKEARIAGKGLWEEKTCDYQNNKK